MKILSRKITSASSVFALAATFVAALGVVSVVSAEKVTLTFWKSPHTSIDKDIYAPILQAFERAYPGIKVEHMLVPWAAYTEKYTTAFASANPPDVHYAVDEFYPMYAEAGALADLYTVGSSREIAELRGGIPDSMWHAAHYKGEFVGIPYLTSGLALVYNKNLLAKAGFDLPPDTWDDVIKYCRKLTIKDASGKAVQWGWADLPFETEEAKPAYYLYQAGARLLNKDNTGPGFDNPEGLASFKLCEILYQKEKIALPIGKYPGRTIDDAFFTGKFAMWLAHEHLLTTARKGYPNFPIGAAITPKGPGGRGAYVGFGLLAIAKKSKHKKEALGLIKWLTSLENEKVYCEASFLGPANTFVTAFEGDEIRQVWIKNAANSIPFPLMVKLDQLRKLLYKEFQALMVGQKTAEQTQKDAVAIFKSILD